jgi:glycine betaine catabolism B
MRAFFEYSEAVAPEIFTFWFRPEGDFSYLAGQITDVRLPHADTDNRGDTRWFTLSSAPSEPLLGITMKFPEPGSSYKRAIRALRPGDAAYFSEPIGDFVLPKSPAIPLLFVVGGIGVAGMRSLVKQLADSNEQRTVELLYGVHDECELAYLDLFESYSMNRTVLVSQPSAGWHGSTGRINSQQILDALARQPDLLVYLTGPKRMIVQLLHELKQAGVQDYQLVIDYYPGYD